jgi:putative endonuclease
VPSWFLYIVRCKNGSLYTGITTDVEARVAAHNTGKGAKYTRAFGPVVLVYSKKMKSATAAKKREAVIKKMAKGQKEKLIVTI